MNVDLHDFSSGILGLNGEIFVDGNVLVKAFCNICVSKSCGYVDNQTSVRERENARCCIEQNYVHKLGRVAQSV